MSYVVCVSIFAGAILSRSFVLDTLTIKNISWLQHTPENDLIQKFSNCFTQTFVCCTKQRYAIDLVNFILHEKLFAVTTLFLSSNARALHTNQNSDIFTKFSKCRGNIVFGLEILPQITSKTESTATFIILITLLHQSRESIRKALSRTYHTTLIFHIDFDKSAYLNSSEPLTVKNIIINQYLQSKNLHRQNIIFNNKITKFMSSCYINIYLNGKILYKPRIEDCVASVLGIHLNFTHSHNNRKNSIASVTRNVRLDKHFINKLVRRQKRQILSLNSFSDEWGFMIVGDTERPAGLLKPFDLVIWILSLICLMCFTLYIVILRQANYNESVRTLLLLIGSMVSQPGLEVNSVVNLHSGKKHKFHLNIACCVILLWQAVTLVLNEAYKGSVYSFLTKPAVLSHPDSLEALTNWNVSIFTFSEHYKENFDPDIFQDKYLYSKVLNMTVFAGKRYQGWISFVLSFILEQPINQNYSSNAKQAVMDQVIAVSIIKQSINIYAKQKWTSPIVSVGTRQISLPWHIDNNFVKPIFKRGFDSLFESGLYYLWDLSYIKSKGISIAYEIYEQAQKTGVDMKALIKKFVVDKKYWRSLHNLERTTKFQSETKKFAPVSVHVLVSLFGFVWHSFVAALLTLTMELLMSKCYLFETRNCIY